MAEIPPVATARSVSDKICSLYYAVKLRRLAPAVNSADATTGAATTRPADAADAGPSGEEGKEEGRRSGMTMGSFSCALKCKLQTVKCLTLVGTEGRSSILPHANGQSANQAMPAEHHARPLEIARA